MRFQAIRGGFDGDIAIDDIKMTPGPCPKPTDQCDFESDLCGWYQDDTDDFNWWRALADGAGNARPKVDHTTQSPAGYYMTNNAYDHNEPGMSCVGLDVK